MKQQHKLLSIVSPVHNEEQNVGRFYRQLVDFVRSLPYDFELIFVDDGSDDGSAAEIARLKTSGNLAVRPIELSRNFGKEIALTAGIEAARGDAVILIDSDLQHPIETIGAFITEWENGSEVVIGVRSRPASDTHFKRFGSMAFYSLMNRIGETDIVPNATDFRLLDRVVVDAFLRFTERQRITRGLIDWLGFKRSTVTFDAQPRQHGKPSYTTFKLTKLAIDGFTAHSLLPLRLAGALGVVITFFSGLLGLFTLVENNFLNDPLNLNPSGTALLAILLLFLVGIILSCLGIIASYIARIHSEVSNRPLYVVRKERGR